jgi:hypothetical protein
LAWQQQRFLRAFRDDVVMLPELLDLVKVDAPRVARWLRRDYFREALAEMTVELRRMGWLKIELMYKWALAMLAEMQTDPSKRDGLVIYLCRVIVEEYDRARRRRARGSWKRAKKKVQEPTDLCHPNAKDREEELMAILSARGGG